LENFWPLPKGRLAEALERGKIVPLFSPMILVGAVSKHLPMSLSVSHVTGLITARILSPPVFGVLLQSREKREDVYNILWVLVFGFATLNILALVARQFDDRRRFSFGEIVAILVVVVAVMLLASELLYQFKIFPIKLSR
jgi:hypothetical protein